MQNAPITIVGRVVGDLKTAGSAENKVLKIRVASSRGYKKDDQWNNFDTLYITVEAWGQLGENAAESLVKGTPIIAHGMLYTSEWTTTDGRKAQAVVMRALNIGVDLNTNLVGYRESRAPFEHSPKGVDIPLASRFVERVKDTSPETPEEDKELVAAGSTADIGLAAPF